MSPFCFPALGREILGTKALQGALRESKCRVNRWDIIAVSYTHLDVYKRQDEYGALAYTFVETVDAMHPYYAMRAVGGGIFLFGAIVMLFNVLMTVRKSATSGSLQKARLAAASA